MTLEQFREWGLKGLGLGLGLLIIGQILYLMVKALLWSPLRDQPEQPAPPPEPEKPPESLLDATIHWFSMLAMVLAMGLWRDATDWMEVWGSLPIVVVPLLWKARRILTWPLATLWLGGGWALVYGVYIVMARLSDIDQPWGVRFVAMLALAGTLYASAKDGPMKPRSWLFVLGLALFLWVVKYTEAVFFIAAFVILMPVVQLIRRNWLANQ